MAKADRALAMTGPEREMLDAIGVPAAAVSADGHFVVNASWQQAFGTSEQSPWGFLSAIDIDDRALLEQDVMKVFELPARTEGEFQARRANDTIATMGFSATPMRLTHHEGQGVLVVCWDLTGERRYEERLAFMAGHDPLTGLANRRAFEDSLERAVSRAQRGSRSCLVLFDMDHLKEFNDHLGHLAGDHAIVNLAVLLRRHLRSGDLPGRIGGDEFAVLLEDATLDKALEIAERIRLAATSEEFVTGARSEGLGVSGGVAEAEPGVDAATLLDRADAALYEAKRAGRGCVRSWTPEMTETGSPGRLAERVREAFANDGFCLLFQPVVRLEDGRVAYYESLLRMRRSDGTLSGPGEFLGAVERLGLMAQLTHLVVDRALSKLVEFPVASISVNLSASDVGDEVLLEQVAALLEQAEGSRERLLFEVSESILLSNLAGGRAWMERLVPLGCRFVLDNFGTGIGMFVLLKESRISQVKLSRTVMRAMAAEERNRSFVTALRELIEAQGKLAVAEYLETEELLRDVREAGFELGQGFSLQSPVADLAALIAETAESRT